MTSHRNKAIGGTVARPSRHRRSGAGGGAARAAASVPVGLNGHPQSAAVLTGNLAQGGAGGSGANGGAGWGGGLMIDGFNPPATENATATVEDTSITGNLALGGAGGAGAVPRGRGRRRL